MEAQPAAWCGFLMSDDLAIAVGRRLAAVRKALGLNQIEFAAPANLSQPQYNQFENGKRLLTVEAALRLCAVYSLSMDYLYRGDIGGLPMRLVALLRERAPDVLDLTENVVDNSTHSESRTRCRRVAR